MIPISIVNGGYKPTHITGGLRIVPSSIFVTCKNKQKYSNVKLAGGWPTPLKNMKVSWDDDIHKNWMDSHNPAMFQTTNQQTFLTKLIPTNWGSLQHVMGVSWDCLRGAWSIQQFMVNPCREITHVAWNPQKIVQICIENTVPMFQTPFLGVSIRRWYLPSYFTQVNPPTSSEIKGFHGKLVGQ